MKQDDNMECRDGIGARGLRTKLIVNYLPQSMSDQEFKNLFANIGPLDSFNVMRDKATNYSYGYGFVDYTAPESAAQAIATLNGHKVQNKTLKVAYSKPPGSSKNVNLHVTGLGPHTTEEKLRELFNTYGEIVTTKILYNPDGSSKGAGFVLFKEKPHADAAMKALNGYSDGYGLSLVIKVARETTDQQRRHPKYLDYMKQIGQIGFCAPQVASNAGVVPYGQMQVGTTYGGGYGYPMNDPQKVMRGRGQATRFNPMARPIGGPPGGMVDTPTNTVFVYNIGPNATESDMYSLFSRYGRITKVDILAEKGYAFVHMPIPQEASGAIAALNGYLFNNRPLQVSIKKLNN